MHFIYTYFIEITISYLTEIRSVISEVNHDGEQSLIFARVSKTGVVMHRVRVDNYQLVTGKILLR
jgi:hypothetical protein